LRMSRMYGPLKPTSRGFRMVAAATSIVMAAEPW
jgi:hypothetical protein